MLLPAVTVQAGGKITYYGEKAGILRPCMGAPVAVCKEIIINDGDDGRLDPTFPPGGDDVRPFLPGGDEVTIPGEDDYLRPLSVSDDTQVTVIVDGMYYECPASWVNWEDGSITPR